MFTMIDREHLPTSAISQIERDYIFANKAPPNSWAIFLGRVKSVDWDFRFRHHGAISIPIAGGDKLTDYNNLSICTVGFRNLLLHAVSHETDIAINDPEGYARELDIIPIFPFVREFNFRDLKRLRKAAANEVADGIAMSMFGIGKDFKTRFPN